MSGWPEGTARVGALALIPLEWVACRAFGHPWKTDVGYGVDSTDDQGRRVTHVSWRWRNDTCIRCGMVVERIYDPFFQLTDTHYTEPNIPEAGLYYYLPPHPEGATDEEKHDWRREAREEYWRRLAGPPPEEQGTPP